MIRLSKTDEPKILVERAAEWTRAVVGKIDVGEEPTQAEKTRYRHSAVKAQLVIETSGKCAYCESKLQHIHHGDVEHIYPKSLDLGRAFEWGNLTLACEICNQNKSNNDPYIENIIDPYAVDPKEHIRFLGPMIVSQGTLLGSSTLAILRLARAELNERRQKQVESLLSIFERLYRDGIRLTVPLR